MPYDGPGKRVEVTFPGKGANNAEATPTNTFAVVDNKVLLLTKTDQIGRYVDPTSKEATEIQPAEKCVGFQGGVHEVACSGDLAALQVGDKLWINSHDHTIVQSAGGGTGGSDANEKSSVKVQGTGGFFKLTVLPGTQNEGTTADIKWNATPAEVREALEALPGINSGDVVVTGGPGSESGAAPYIIEWTGQYEKTDVAAPTATDTLTGGEEKVTITTGTAGAGSTDVTFPLGVVDEIDTSRNPDVARVNTDALAAFIVG